MIRVEIDLKKNLLTMRYSGRVGAVDMEKRLGEVEAAVKGMEPGFRLLTDLGGLESMEVGCAPFIDRVMDLCNARGVRKVVRIVPDAKKDIGFRVMSYFHFGRKVHIVTCETAEEAARALVG